MGVEIWNMLLTGFMRFSHWIVAVQYSYLVPNRGWLGPLWASCLDRWPPERPAVSWHTSSAPPHSTPSTSDPSLRAGHRRIMSRSILIISAILLPPAFPHVRKISQDLCCSNTRETHKTLDHFTDLCSLSVKNLTQPHAWVGDLWVQITVQTSLWILVNITKCFES